MLESLAGLPSLWHALCAGLFGLLVGSFLNVVIYRFPLRLKHQWSAQSHEWLHDEPYPEQAPPSILWPPSHCGHCKSPVRAWQNIPVLSYLLLRAKCANCKQAISARYPLVELLTGLASFWVVQHFGWSTQSLFALLLTWALITLSFIDFDHKLLPDDIVLPLLWLGLAINLPSTFTDLHSAVIGALAGYLSLWSVFQLFKIITGKEGMGHGDFKLLALFGAWLGWQMLPQIILISTALGSIVGLSLILLRRSQFGSKLPFGPYIALAGWIAMLYGAKINHTYLQLSGL